MIKIVIALSLVLPLVTPDSPPRSSPQNRYCAAVSSQETAKSIGEIFDDSNIVFSSPLSRHCQYPFAATATATIFCCFDSKGHSSLNKKVLALFKLKGVFLI
ncbi:MAG TPA: hypothetical protein VGK65_03540 [Candidatus Binatia bacterium]|jgi:hypothetical protein